MPAAPGDASRAVLINAVSSGGSSVTRSIVDELVSIPRSFCGGTGGGVLPGATGRTFGSSNSTRRIWPA